MKMQKLLVAVWAFGGGTWLINTINHFDIMSIVMLVLSLLMVVINIINEPK